MKLEKEKMQPQIIEEKKKKSLFSRMMKR